MAKIICVVGPTAVGKTALAVALAERRNGEVLSCDSMQLYRGMTIGTAAPTEEEMRGVPHHMVGVADPAEPFSVGRYVAMADPILQDILARGKTAVLCGGTGLYLDSLMAGRDFAPFPSTGRREELERMADERGIGAVLDYLRTFDPESADRLDPGNRRRIIRAVEVYLETGKTITQHNRETAARPPKYRGCWIGLDDSNRQALYDRMAERVRDMLDRGLLDELRALLDAGVPRNATSLQAIGYKEFLSALDGSCTVEEAAEIVVRETRRYAKRQRTWFRRNREIHWIDRTEFPDFETVLTRAEQILTGFDKAQ